MTTTCYHEGVGADARAVIDRVVARARAEVAGADQLRFEVVPAPAINIDGKLCFGAFSPELSLVLLAGEPPEPDITRAEWLETMLPEVISHELAHQAGGWLIESSGPRFVPAPTWRALHAVWLAQRAGRL